MNTTADLSILTLIANASLVVKAVLAILIVLSLASWTVIFQKFFVVRRAMRQTDDFESRFWSGTELTKLLDTANRSRDTSGMEERIFAAGMNEFMKQRQTAGLALQKPAKPAGPCRYGQQRLPRYAGSLYP